MSIRRGARRWLRSALGWRGGAPRWPRPSARSGVGRLAPELLDVAEWPYVLLGCSYASLAVGLLIVGAQRQRELEHALRTGAHVPLRFRTVGLFTVGGVAPAARGNRLSLAAQTV